MQGKWAEMISLFFQLSVPVSTYMIVKLLFIEFFPFFVPMKILFDLILQDLSVLFQIFY